jgi:hypothetical protein
MTTLDRRERGGISTIRGTTFFNLTLKIGIFTHEVDKTICYHMPKVDFTITQE